MVTDPKWDRHRCDLQWWQFTGDHVLLTRISSSPPLHLSEMWCTWCHLKCTTVPPDLTALAVKRVFFTSSAFSVKMFHLSALSDKKQFTKKDDRVHHVTIRAGPNRKSNDPGEDIVSANQQDDWRSLVFSKSLIKVLFASTHKQSKGNKGRKVRTADESFTNRWRSDGC